MAVETRTAQITAAQCLAETLDGYGVTHVFLVPAIASTTLVELEKRTSITRVVTHGEKAAAYMADGYARATGRPGVCLAQAVGAANLAAGLRDAWLAASPVLAITGGPYENTRGRHTYQQADDIQLFKPLTKFSERVTTASRLPDLLRQAFRVATTGRPGPVHLELEGHLGEVEDETAELEVLVEEQFTRVPAFRPYPDVGAVADVARLIRAAERPLIVAGGGVRASGAQAELVALAEALSIPVATSMDAKDTIPGDHPLNVGVVGVYSRETANRTILEADLVFFAGSAMGSQVTYNWQLPRRGTTVVQLDIDPEQLGRHYPNVVPLLGDAKLTLAQLLELSSGSDRSDWLERVAAISRAWRDEVQPLLESDEVPLRPERLCAELSGVLPREALLVVDTGHAGMWTGAMVDLTKPGQGYIRAAGSLGWALPAGIGAKLAVPERPVAVFNGDGGLWYHLSELETAVRWCVGLVVVVNNNDALNQEIGPYTKAYGGALQGRHAELWQFEETDFGRVAESVGATGVRVTQPQELQDALEGAFEQAERARAPVVVDVQTEMTAMAPTGYLE